MTPGREGVCLAIGVFDGLHLGHQRVIGCARADAEKFGGALVVVTFDRHPNAVVAPRQVPPLIYPLTKKLEVIASLGVNTCCVISFDKSFSQISGAQFIRDLVRPEKIVRSISVGENFKFGCQRSGDVVLLDSLGKELGYELHALPDVLLQGQPVSSTRIREAIRQGQFELAGELLGRPYTLSGQIIAGAQLGRKLGYPTANLNVAGTVAPPPGVYAALAQAGPRQYRAAVNIGHRPTVYSSPDGLSVEAYLLDFNGNLYGEELELTFLKQLRSEEKYPSLAALQKQIGRDVEMVRALNVI